MQKNFEKMNYLIKWNSGLIFGFYLIDFASDIFFSLELLMHVDENGIINVYMILFIASITFIFVPLIINLIQLNNEFRDWLTDPILASTEVPLWILSYI